jgi:hypothetical protein
MIIEEKVYELATEGIHSLKVVSVDDLGLVETNYGTKEQVRIRVEVTDQKSTDGTPVTVSIQGTKSIGIKSTIGKFIRSLGISVEGQFDMDDLIGFKFQAVIEHNKNATTGKTYANIGSILKSRPKVATTTDEI